MRIKGKKSGIILTETLVAISMMMVATLIMSNIMNNAMTTMKLSRGYLIAQGLSTEGVEAVKNIVSTNKLVASEDRACWLRIDPSQPCDVVGINASVDTDYVVEFLNGKWSLVKSSSGDPLDLKNKLTEDGFYQISTGAELAYMSRDSGEEPTPYYRSIRFKNIDAANNDFVVFDVLLQWKEGAKVREIKRTITFVN
jgi:hypothetical protein